MENCQKKITISLEVMETEFPILECSVNVFVNILQYNSSPLYYINLTTKKDLVQWCE